MALNHFLSPDKKNKFCTVKNLRNESDVEQFFMLPLLKELGYSEDYIETKTTIKEKSLGKGKKRKNYKPDYICYADKEHLKPVLLIDTKSPYENAEYGLEDAQLYTAILRRSLEEPKPDQICIGSNGIRTLVKHYEANSLLYDLQFDDFDDENIKFSNFKSDLQRLNRRKAITVTTEPFDFKKPDLSEIKGIFEISHNTIWSKEKMSPQSAFYEFCKLMFIKLNEDKKLRADAELKEKIDASRPLPKNKVFFSSHWVAQNEHVEPNPVNAILFRQLRDNLEYEVLNKKKKRIFEKNEQINLKPNTIKEVIKLLEHHDLFGIDEDLNGRLFETFLSATMRGRELGQFFTPRSIVEFMVDLGDIRVGKDYTDYVCDACCGSGGFLIEAMAKMVEKVEQSKILSGREKKEIKQSIRDNHLFGIDAGKEPPIARIARINMYLHGDGGSRIYFADALDKHLLIEEDITPELKTEREELRGILLNGQKFDVVLTNPPFAMRYKLKDADQRRILEQYDLAYYFDKKNSKKIRASLRSNVMFLERYYDLLSDSGKLLIVIDESVLNTKTAKPVRDFIYKNFLIKGVISLPQEAFIEAGSNVKTSILYLVKKTGLEEEQPYTFFARSESIETTKSDLLRILGKFLEFQKNGEVHQEVEKHWSQKSKFIITKLDINNYRFDFEWFDPRHEAMLKKLNEIARDKNYKVNTIDFFCKPFRGKTAEHYVSEGIPILKLRNITGQGINWDTDNILKSFYDDNPSFHLRFNDVLVTSTGVGTIGRVDLFDSNRMCTADGHVAVLRVDDKKLLPQYLVYYLRSIFGQMQMEKFTTGSTGQTELEEDSIGKIVIIFPESTEEQSNLAKVAKDLEEIAWKAREDYLHNLDMSRSEFAKILGL